MITAAFIFAFSFAVTIQFVVYSWRARMLRVVSSTSSDAAMVSGKLLKSSDFADVSAFEDLCPSLDASTKYSLRSVQAYHRCLQMLGNANWVKSEMLLCSRYAAALLVQRLAHNQALAAEVRSF